MLQFFQQYRLCAVRVTGNLIHMISSITVVLYCMPAGTVCIMISSWVVILVELLLVLNIDGTPHKVSNYNNILIAVTLYHRMLLSYWSVIYMSVSRSFVACWSS